MTARSPRATALLDQADAVVRHGLRLMTQFADQFGGELREGLPSGPAAAVQARFSRTAASGQYDRANIAWETAVRKLAEHRILDSANSGYNTTGGWIAGKANNGTRDKLARAEATARKQRDDAGEALRQARVVFRSALGKARHALLLATVAGVPL